MDIQDHIETLQRYRDFRPTGFDHHYNIDHAVGAPREHWIVMPTAQNRDSHAFERANFDATVKTLGGESETVEIHRFGHWACGWFEIIIVDPDSPQATTAAEIACALGDYPVVDDELLSQYESDEIEQEWACCLIRDDFSTRLAAAFREGGDDHTADWIDDATADQIDELRRIAEDRTAAYVEYREGGCHWPLDRWIEEITAGDIEAAR